MNSFALNRFVKLEKKEKEKIKQSEIKRKRNQQKRDRNKQEKGFERTLFAVLD